MHHLSSQARADGSRRSRCASVPQVSSDWPHWLTAMAFITEG